MSPWPRTPPPDSSPAIPAPSFTLLNAEGSEVSLSDFAGRQVVVYFYPAAMTPGCTTEAIDFSSSLQAFREAGFDVVGISPDPVERLARFTDKENLGVTLLANPERDVLIGVRRLRREDPLRQDHRGCHPLDFVVDVTADGTASVRTAQYNVKATGHVERLLPRTRDRRLRVAAARTRPRASSTAVAEAAYLAPVKA